MKNISIFAQPVYELKYLRRVSSLIRGEQIAAYMQNARLNPTSGYKNDVCIYVKPHVKPGQDFKFEGYPYLDILDGYDLWHLLSMHEEVPVIVFSELDVETMSRKVKNKIVLIPHHHVNFERSIRERDCVTKIGIIGSPGAFQFIPDEIRRGIAERGMELIEYSTFYPRMSVVKYYKNIDIGLVWRPYRISLSNPFKIVNTSSFGVPTIALDEPAFKEMEGCYIPVHTPEEFLTQLDALRTSSTLYNDISKTCLKKSERYHIENIAKLYQELT
jgi:hypothetical protein